MPPTTLLGALLALCKLYSFTALEEPSACLVLQREGLHYASTVSKGGLRHQEAGSQALGDPSQGPQCQIMASSVRDGGNVCAELTLYARPSRHLSTY